MVSATSRGSYSRRTFAYQEGFPTCNRAENTNNTHASVMIEGAQPHRCYISTLMLSQNTH
jgi:hypothetical protein